MRALLVAEQMRRRVPGGIGTYIRGLVRGLGETDVDATAWASRPRRRGGAGDPVAGLGVPVVTSPLPGQALVLAWDLGLARAPDGFDVVHATSLAVPPRPGGDTTLTVTVHDLAWRRAPETFPPRGRRWHEAALGRALSRAAILVTPSKQTADDLVAAGATAAKVEVVDEGCDHLPPPDRARAEEFLAERGVTREYLLTVSTLEPRKNLARLVAAYHAVRPRLPEPWPLVVVGPRGWGEALPEPAETEARHGVVLAGAVDDGAVLAALYQGARLVASVPLVEGFGLPAVEPMALGTPVVASPQPSTGGAAYEVDPLDVDGIGDALVRVATDPALRADLVAAGHARAATLTWAATAARHADIWRSLRPTVQR